MKLKDVLAAKILELRPRTARLLKEARDVELDTVTVGSCLGGARGVKCLVTDISKIDPDEGLRLRGYTVGEVLDRLPKLPGCEVPSVEALYWLLLTGDVPTAAQASGLCRELAGRRELPEYVLDVLAAMPEDSHPVALFSAAVLALQRESRFARSLAEGLPRKGYWEPMYEDTLDVLARLPAVGAAVYGLKYGGAEALKAKAPDLGGEFAGLMGLGKPYDDVCRLHFILHSDLEGGNVSAHAARLVGSGLSDAYYALSAMAGGLAGPLHGLANQEFLRWILGVMETGSDEDSLRRAAESLLDGGRVIPGYGHAVMRRTDSRYAALRDFCLKHLPDDPVFQCIERLCRVVPPLLQARGKAKNPWPNLDAQSGVLHWHYGVREYDFYPVLFCVGRSLGVCASLVWDRALGYPIESPRSVTTEELEAAERRVRG